MILQRRAGHLIGEKSRCLRHVANFHRGGCVKFRMIGRQQNVARVGHHGFHHAGFIHVKLHHRAVVLNRTDAGHEIVRPKTRHKRRRRRPDNAAVVRAQRAARHHHFKARVLIQNMRHPQAVGDDAQMIMVKQRPGNVLYGRADGDENS